MSTRDEAKRHAADILQAVELYVLACRTGSAKASGAMFAEVRDAIADALDWAQRTPPEEP